MRWDLTRRQLHIPYSHRMSLNSWVGKEVDMIHVEIGPDQRQFLACTLHHRDVGILNTEVNRWLCARQSRLVWLKNGWCAGPVETTTGRFSWLASTRGIAWSWIVGGTPPTSWIASNRLFFGVNCFPVWGNAPSSDGVRTASDAGPGASEASIRPGGRDAGRRQAARRSGARTSLGGVYDYTFL